MARPQDEVAALLNLVGQTVRDYAAELLANGVRVRVVAMAKGSASDTRVNVARTQYALSNGNTSRPLKCLRASSVNGEVALSANSVFIPCQYASNAARPDPPH